MNGENYTEDAAIQRAPITVEVVLSEPSTNETEIWNNNISEIFPISRINVINGKPIAIVDQPYSGYTIEGNMVDNVFDGKVLVRNPSNKVIAKYKYVKGKPTGKCKVYYSDGSLYFKGTLKEGYREGSGIEYDRKGNVLFQGTYHNGMRRFSMGKRDGFIVEYSKLGNPTVAYKENKQGLKHGICYTFVNGRIDRGEKWENGKMIRIVKDFCGKRMTEFGSKGEVVYIGGFINSLSENYPRNGKGIGKSFFGKYAFEANWKNGTSIKEIWIHSIPYLIFVIVIIILVLLLLFLVF